jgi:hypothetical protein
MTEEEAGKSTPGRARSLADMVMPRRPAGIPYEDGEDYDARALLTVNGYTVEPGELIALLDSDIGILQAAAARTLGASNERAAIVPLERLAHDAAVEETTRAQAAFALARMDVAGARDLLVELLELPFEASPAPLQAAGALARLGDPRGINVISAAIDSPNRVTAMIASKQLHPFISLDGSTLPGGGRVDVFEVFGRALRRPEPNIVGEARAQLATLDTEQSRAMLSAHPARED